MARPKKNPAEQVMRSFMTLNDADKEKVLFAINAIHAVALAPLEVQPVRDALAKRRKKSAANAAVPVE